ncbi:MAG: hypothetical protein ACFCU4_09450 [Puniceicoccaceae bacterium]
MQRIGVWIHVFRVNGKARVNLYIFIPHPEWKSAIGTVTVVARDFQRAEQLALATAKSNGFPGVCFSIIKEPIEDAEAAKGHWVEIERYRDVDDEERTVFWQYGIAVNGG